MKMTERRRYVGWASKTVLRIVAFVAYKSGSDAGQRGKGTEFLQPRVE